MEEYLWGVVAAEMPASFEEEALKAQACAARTYTVTLQEASSPRHPDARSAMTAAAARRIWTGRRRRPAGGPMRNCTAERSSGPWRRPMDWGCSITGRPSRRCFFPPLQAGRWGQWRHGGIRWTIWWEWRAGGGGGAQLPQSGGPDGGRGQDGGAGTVSGGGPVRGLGVVLAAGRKFSRRSGLRGSGSVTLTGSEVRTLFGLRSASFSVAAAVFPAAFALCFAASFARFWYCLLSRCFCQYRVK